MTFSLVLVLAVVLFLILSLYREWISPPMTFFIAVGILVLSGVITPAEALSGFANDQVAVVILLLLLNEVLRRSALLELIFDRIFHGVSAEKGFVRRMSLYVSSISTLLNNTPIVAMLLPYVYNWGKRHKVAPSRLLIPLSYAAIFGGGVTLIGTSTNLVVNGLAVEEGLEPLGVFDFTPIGLPLMLAGLVYLLIFSGPLLPHRPGAMEQFVETSREYLVETQVAKKSPLIGKTLEEAGLRHLQGLYVVELIRGKHHLSPVSPLEMLEEDDILILAGKTDLISDLQSPEKGLTLPHARYLPEHHRTDMVEVVVSYNSRLIGKKVRETDFRSHYDAAILAIHRGGEKLSGKIGEMELRAGDALLLLAGADFRGRVAGVQAFFIISRRGAYPKLRAKKALWIFTGLIAAVILSAFEVLPLFSSLLALLVLLLFFKLVPLDEIRRGLDYGLVFVLVLGIALGKAMTSSGAAGLLAGGLTSVAMPFGPMAVLFVIYLAANVLTAIMSNAAVAALMLPVALQAAYSLNIEPTPMLFIVAFGAGADFITPIGYHTNLMVYGPGGYTYRDFFRVGLPLNLLYLVGTVSIVGWRYDLF